MTEKDQTNLKAPRGVAPAKRPHFWHIIRTCIFPKTKRVDTPDWHTLLAFSMVIIATSGAIVAGGTAVAEQEANRLERFLTWGHRIAISEWQQGLADAATRRELELRITAYRRLSQEYLKAARQQGVQGSCLHQQAQEELAAARALEPVVKALPKLPDEQNPGAIEASLQKKVAFYLANLGFQTVWHGHSWVEKTPRQTDAIQSMWDPLNQTLEEAHLMVKRLAFGVVLFVAALILLSLSSLFGRQHFLHNRFYILGCLVTAGATVFVILVLKWHKDLIWDLLTIMYYQRLLAVFLAPPCLLLVFLLWSLVNFGRQCRRWHKARRKREDEPYDGHDIEADSVKPDISFPPLRETADEFSRCTVLLIAITVFCSALCGLGYSYSASKAGNAAHKTLKSLLDMEVRSSKSHTINNDILLQLADFYEHRARLTVALHSVQDETSLPKDGFAALTGSRDKSNDKLPDTLPNDATTKELLSHFPDAPHFGVQAEQLPIIDAQPLEVGGDLRSPSKITWPPSRRSENNWWGPIADWYAFSRSCVALHARAQIFLGILTVFAMAIYLFAQAHGMGKGSAGNLLVRNGVLLLMIGIICFGIILAPDLMSQTQASMREQVQSESAASYAIAKKEYPTADAAQNFKELLYGSQGMIDKSSTANLAPPGPASPPAQGQSSQAETPPAAAQLDESLRESIRQQEQVLNHLRGIGLAEPAELLDKLGLDNLLLGVNNHNRAEVNKRLKYFQRAEKRASLGGNRQEMAVSHLNHAIGNLVSEESPEIDPEAIRQIIDTEDRRLIISSFSLLRGLERSYCGPQTNKQKLCAAVQKAKEQLVDAWPLPNSPSRPTPSMIPDCGGHTGESTFIQVSPQAVQWQGQLPQFRRGRDHLVLVWYAKGQKETVWRVLPLVSGPVAPGELTAAKNSPESWVITRSPLTLSGYKECLSAGLYKAELYLNGKVISAPPETRNAFGDFEPQPLLELNVGLCLPNSWEPVNVPGQLGDINLYGRGFQSPKHRLAAFVFRFYAKAVDKTAAVQRAKNLLVQGPWKIKDTDVFVPYDPGNCKTMTPSPRGFYKYWFSPEGTEHVGIVLSDAAPLCELCNILDSMGTIDQ